MDEVVLSLSCGHTATGKPTSERKRCRECKQQVRVVEVLGAVETHDDEPFHLNRHEERVLAALEAGRPLRDIANEMYPSVPVADRWPRLNRTLLLLEARKLVALKWQDGTSVWEVAPTGPWTISRDEARRRLRHKSPSR